LIKFILRRIAWMLPVLLIILLVVFLLMHAIPGSPFDADGGTRALANTSMDKITHEALNRRFGLNQPLWKQFTGYLVGRSLPDGSFDCGLICANMGPSYRQPGRMVEDILFAAPKNQTFFQSRFGYSVRLSLYAFAVALLIGMPLGIVAAVKHRTWLDMAIKTFATLLIAMPNFVLGLLIIIVLGGELHWITIAPTSWQTIDPKVWFAPITILSLGTMAAFIRLTRASLLEVMRQDFVRTARAKGARERRVVILHILKNSLIPLITFSGPALMELFTGSFVIEVMFGYPGMGREFIQSIVRLDYSMIMAVALIYALLIVGINILVDVLYGTVDPRIRTA
jgi:ABC-type dipeptide/oligopeptide/nickel transport system permease component